MERPFSPTDEELDYFMSPTVQSTIQNSSHQFKESAQAPPTRKMPAEITLPGAVEDEIEFQKSKVPKPQALFRRESQPLKDYRLEQSQGERTVDSVSPSAEPSKNDVSKTRKTMEEW